MVLQNVCSGTDIWMSTFEKLSRFLQKITIILVYLYRRIYDGRKRWISQDRGRIFAYMQVRKLQIYNAMTLSKYFGNIQYFGCKTKVLIDNVKNVTAWERG